MPFRTLSPIFPALAAAVLACAPAAAQQREDMPVPVAARDSVARAAAEAVRETYVFAERGRAAARAVLDGVAAGRYRALATASALSDTLTADLRRATGDQHLLVQYSVRPRPAVPGAAQMTAADSARQREAGEWRNYGLHRVERLEGNVGYLELGRFDDPALAAPTVAAAMALLAGTDALVIDLRANGGGHASMVSHLLGYFVERPTHHATLHRRAPGDTAQAWTPAEVPGPRYLGRPVYLLTSARTFSAAEAFAYDLRALGIATVVGERTRGGANPGSWRMIGDHFGVFVPTARVENTLTRGNWEGVGVEPAIAAAEADARRAAHVAALERLVAEQGDSPRAPRWREALDEVRARAAASPPAR
ncbi:MAG TPA: S41 family peptidase [Longimicrobium sp.]|nr:S41 family peptidase [Longimicrobium sp.]